ncbi:LysR substrate-binding domain-containing protein [Sphingomonas nostoxanthinifaciens]|uniref:LysR substrate-binding domain-containing protein n=1 Tax=Sphingomonas nostoxanthinifaciens TaxID=2872652 RepID=UPI001CC206D8|nr:LysR substrate-binding domain-containing protein [Sphingomonas nostoxanthinifaciens]UAK25253.1 LysR family transcriptional regulator [Sphingomonas nostoxanthinifaciens]
MIDLRQMRYFVALGDTLHFGRAAARLNVTQPPLSRQIAALEAALGVLLVERRPRAIVLTEAGQAFLDECRQILARVDAACDAARRIDRGELDRLSIGFMMHAAHSVAAGLASRFMAAFPNVAVQLRDMLPSTLLEEVVAGRIDAGILFAPQPMRGLAMRTVLREPLCCALPADHPLGQLAIVPAAVLRDLPFITTPADLSPNLRATILDYCHAAGFVPRIVMEVQVHQTIASLVGEGMGIALVPQSLQRLGLPNIAFRPLEGAPTIDNVLLWRENNANPALRALLDLTA